MCLAIPGKIQSIDKDKLADVDFNGIKREVSVELVPNAEVGSYVLVHAGFAIEIVDEKEAIRSLEILDDLSEI